MVDGDGEPLRARIAGRLQDFERSRHEDPALRHAAVAIVVATATGDADPCFLLTRRASRLGRHAGQWALPGGRVDAGETAVAAALRELDEEIGLRLAPDAVLGRLDDYPTRSGFAITPVVMWGGAVGELHPDPGEVAAVYRVPLADLDRPEVPHLERIPESDRPVLSIPFVSLGQRVFAPTAAMLFQFREVALHARATRVDGYDQPLFAWR